MNLDPRTPVIVGVGQISQPELPAPEPVALIAEAARLAGDDAAAPSLLGSLDSIRIVNLLSRAYPDPAALVAGLLGATPRETVATTAGGNTPQVLLNRTAEDIMAGRLDVALIGGAESWRTRSWYKARGEKAPWSQQDAATTPTVTVGEELVLAAAEELALGLGAPVQFYPMFETALMVSAAAAGTKPDDHLSGAAALWARFSAVAATNPYAALPAALTASQIATPTPDNRYIGWPYTKRMNSNNNVDQAAVVMMCSVEAAVAAGVPRDRWVFLHAGSRASDQVDVIRRDRLDASPAIRAVGRDTLALAGIGVDDLELVDLYSCFPSAVQVAARELGLDLQRDLTVTGGLTFAGGPWNNYVTHGIATMVERLRARPDAYGLCTANGGNLTKHAAGVYAAFPPATPPRFGHPQEQVDATPRRAVAPRGWQGSGRLEAWTVMHDRAGQPEVAFAYGLTGDGARLVGASRDSDLLAALAGGTAMSSLSSVGPPVAVWDGDGGFAL
ncbi:acetyl-CoA acetyltransferase [Acidiferrimicrobium sp. IK]|uniref:acetyl-CoA acetyltransferase n=1 Tax=Acidiferrimicrobium sp. IK TaxID=2871700 RepID=UPI0021CB5283|nr:acetyl-CoA acetyltransferase [Acidiferrimicrobium sp. IK]MCU4183977.1 acetyl-CoA acetyltransferase [Acidiferrimicrobium sp. IK]